MTTSREQQSTAAQQWQQLGAMTITDLYIPDSAPEKSVIYTPEASFAPAKMLQQLTEIRNSCRIHASSSRDYFMVYGGIRYRGHRQTTSTGVEHVLRKMSKEIIPFDKIGLPFEVRKILAAESFGSSGGLVLVCGEPGHGKTTTCASLAMNRVMTHGSFLLSVEDPPEYQMEGNYQLSDGRVGKVMQVPAGSKGFAGEIRDALRCYPSISGGAILWVGEVRDGSTAAELLKASTNGQFVIATMHAGTIVGLLERLLSLATEELAAEQAKLLLGESFRAAICQRLEKDSTGATKYSAKYLFSKDGSSSVAARLRTGNFQMLSSELAQQEILLQNTKLMSTLRLAV